MLVLKAIILGAVQGVTEFFPVSSSGHLSLLGNAMGIQTDLLFTILLHIGSLAAVILYFRVEIIRCLIELKNIFKDIHYNIKRLLFYSGDIEGPRYKKVVSNNYRKLVTLLIVTMIPTVAISIILIPVVEMLNNNILCSGMGLLITALVLFVASYAGKNRKGPKEAKYTDALMIGAFQSIAVLPGVSRFGMVLSSSIFRGFTKKFAKLYSFLLLVPTIIGSLILEASRAGTAPTYIGILPGILGMITALAVGYCVIKFAVRVINRASLSIFAFYCVCIGFISILCYLLV